MSRRARPQKARRSGAIWDTIVGTNPGRPNDSWLLPHPPSLTSAAPESARSLAPHRPARRLTSSRLWIAAPGALTTPRPERHSRFSGGRGIRTHETWLNVQRFSRPLGVPALNCGFPAVPTGRGTAQARRQEATSCRAVMARAAATADNGRRQSVTAGHRRSRWEGATDERPRLPCRASMVPTPWCSACGDDRLLRPGNRSAAGRLGPPPCP